ncbi:MAG: helix-turn-helix domain-containing protein [Saprospiraceae bacterium]|nr:helix-turn-helix domain-containing protein [Saprospiraceae bacterium]
MKLIYENFAPDAGSSFRFLTPQLNDFFYWHYHPEYEIVYLEGADGTRHVGEHISRFEGSDLVLIGPYIPHLNFDYGIKKPYKKYVLHIKEDFLEKTFAQMPELSDIKDLFEQARKGVYFYGQSKQQIGETLKNLFQKTHFEQFMAVLELLQTMSKCSEKDTLHANPIGQHYNLKEQQRLKIVYAYIEAHYHERMDIMDLAKLTHLTHAAFCRYFKKMTLMTFTEFVNQYRVNQAKKLLLLDNTVTEICFQCGFESLSYFNRIFKKVTSMSPLQFKKSVLTPQYVFV